MNTTRLLTATCVLAALLTAGCNNPNKSPVDRAVDNTKDALNVRDHEKIRDAGEDVSDAAKDLKQGVKDAANGKK